MFLNSPCVWKHCILSVPRGVICGRDKGAENCVALEKKDHILLGGRPHLVKRILPYSKYLIFFYFVGNIEKLRPRFSRFAKRGWRLRFCILYYTFGILGIGFEIIDIVALSFR